MPIEDIWAKFNIKTTPNIIGEMTYKAIKELREALYQMKPPYLHRSGEDEMATFAYSWT